MFRLDGRDRLLARIEATAGDARRRRLAAAERAHHSRRTSMPGAARRLISLPTDLTVGRVQESFASPDTLSFWALPGFIALLDRSGFSSIRHRLHFQALLALPLLAATMALVCRRLLHAPGTARRRGADDRQRGRRRLRAVRASPRSPRNSARRARCRWSSPPGRRPSSGLMLAVALLLHTEDG